MTEEVNKAVQVLKQGGLIVYPTDTIWGIGCDATNYDAVKRIYELKQREESKSMICLVSDFNMLNQYIEEVPEVAYDILKYANKPTTVIYDRPLRVAENLIAEDNTLAIRIVRNTFCNQLIKKLRKPIVSTSANISNAPSPKSYSEISSDILKGVDYVVNLDRKKKSSKASSIIKLSGVGMVKVIRQ
ncbi:L-threonylcarbamoyladenylate synthase [Pontimicrobium aquaticum]|uniref:L-threonylcarbamoyladenylate synthase n=1 Tax=Pontimicrobium aquaticum TaxID=2565367 RepID=A0A4U0EN52_9FLAO|nr:L-threonylcarbamoyladenylate synthase [Pontimicrobium aquaticum]TJY32858.1 threonylcarbamoyl-AMP synthase [Pontimicrobium aquaticum]